MIAKLVMSRKLAVVLTLFIVLFVTSVLAGIAPSHAAGKSTIGIVVFDGFLTSEVTAPIEVFGKASKKSWFSTYEVVTIAADRKAVTSEEGLRIMPQMTFKDSPQLDVLIVPSSWDLDSLLANKELVGFIKVQAQGATYVASHCAGAFLLGQAGVLDGRRATTYVGGEKSLQKMFPKAKVQYDQHVVTDGNLITSNGAVISYEASLLLLEKLAGPRFTKRVADEIYYTRLLEKGDRNARGFQTIL